MPRCETLPNGLRVVLVPCEAESVAVGVFVESGSRHEPAETAGISHFIEHMLFKGTPTRTPLDITRAIEGRGGNFNAFTGEESTCYFAHLPSEYLSEALDILSDMYLHASIPDDEFAREKGVIIEEIRMYADEPDAVAMENLQRNLFPKSMLGSPVAGSEKTLGPLVAADLRRYIRSHYRPDDTIVAVAGAFDEEKALELVAKGMGAAPARRLAAGSRAPRSGKGGAGSPLKGRVVPEQVVARDVNQLQLALGYRTFGIRDPRKYAATVMDAVLGRGMMSRLFQEVREKRALSYDISSRMQFFGDAGMFTVTAGLDPAKLQKTLRTIDRELRRVAETRVSAGELRRMKEFLTGNFRLGHEKVVSKMFFYAQTLMSFGRLVSPEEQIEGIRAVTAEDVRSVAAAVLRPENRSVSIVEPEKAPAPLPPRRETVDFEN